MNAKVMEEFRKNHGKVGGRFEGTTLLILHTIGARSGKEHINPVMYRKDGQRLLVFASKGGADTNPAWYHNIKAHPDFTVEVGDEKIQVHAEEIKGAERDRLYKEQTKIFSSFADYEKKTKRVIPVIALTPKAKRK
jgi:deazaflavin-dependent oxidoreductase (nitroreductase family)